MKMIISGVTTALRVFNMLVLSLLVVFCAHALTGYLDEASARAASTTLFVLVLWFVIGLFKGDAKVSFARAR